MVTGQSSTLWYTEWYVPIMVSDNIIEERSSMWYLIEGFLDRQEELRQQGLPAIDIAVSSPRDVHGLAFPETDADRVLAALGLPSGFDTVRTNRAEVLLLEFNGEAGGAASNAAGRSNEGEGPPRVTFAGSWEHALPKDLVRRVIERDFLPMIGKHVEVRYPHARVQAPLNNGKFNILLFSAPRGQRGPRPSAGESFGITLHAAEERCYPWSGQGIDIVDEYGFSMGEIVGDNLYIHYDIVHFGIEDELKLLSAILLEALVLMGLKERPPQPQARDLYAEYCTSREAEAKTRLEREAEIVAERLRDCVSTMAHDYEMQREIAGRLRLLEESQGMNAEKYKEEFDSIARVAGVTDVKVVGSVLKVKTELIVIRYRDKDYTIGEMEINVNMAREHRDITIGNLTNTLERSYQHPHVKRRNPCWGNVGPGVSELLAQQEYAVLIPMILQYLTTYTHGDAFIAVDNWPIRERA